MTRSAIDIVSTCVSGIGDDEIDALQPGRDHVVDGVAAGAADPKHDNAGFISRISVMLVIASPVLRQE